jgi:hypothetical protein
VSGQRPFIDPRPQYPRFGQMCVVKCDDGTLRLAYTEDTWDGVRWQDGNHHSFWSMAHPNIIGWKYYSDAEPEEQVAAKKKTSVSEPVQP